MALNLVHEIRVGAIKASIWRESCRGELCHTVTLSRAINGQSPHHTSNRFEVDDLPLVAEVLDLAHLWIHEQAELIA